MLNQEENKEQELEKIKYLREQKGLSYRQIAQLTGMSPKTVYMKYAKNFHEKTEVLRKSELDKFKGV